MFITIFSIFFSLLISYEVFRRFKGFTLFFFIAVPLIVSPLWLTYDSLDWFKWIKTYSLAITVVAITLGRYKKFMNSIFLFNFIYLFLGINILEALVKDAYSFDIVSAMNIFIGLLLILSLIGSKHNLHIERTATKDLIAPKLTTTWILVYTLWNWVYIYAEYPEFSLKHLAVLAVPIIINFLKKGTWLQARAITLGFYVIVSITINPYVENWIPVIQYNETIALTIVVINLFILTFYRLTLNKKIIKKWDKKAPAKRLPFVHFLTSLLKK